MSNAAGTVRKAALTTWEGIWYVLMCVRLAAGYFKKVLTKNVVADVQSTYSSLAHALLRPYRPRRVAATIAACVVALGISIPAPTSASPSPSQSSPADATNMLKGKEATFSGTTGGWVALNNSSLSWTQTPSTLSTGSLDMTATSTAWVYAESAKVAAIPGARYTTQTSLMTPSSGSVGVALAFYNSSGAQISAVAGQSATPTASTWTSVPQAAATAPSGTRTVALIVAAWTASVGQHFYIESPVLANPPTNLLTGDQATFSGTTGGWAPLNNSSLSWTQTPSTLPTGSLDMTATSTAWVYAESPKVAATPGARYTAQASLMTPSSGSVAVALAFYNSSGGQISSVAGQSATPAASTWTTLPQAAAIAPSGTTMVALIVVAWTASVGQQFYIESPLLASPTATVNVDLTNGNSNYLPAPFSQTTTTLGPVSSGTITLNPAKTSQTIDGFGANLTNSSAAVLMSLPSTTLNTVLNNLFNPTNAGISVIRLPMGANDFSANGCSASAASCPSGNYTYDDPPAGAANDWTDPSLNNFNIFPYDQNIVNILHLVQKINPNLTVIASPWTAPPWMKVNALPADRYAAGSNGTLNPSYYGAYAKYFVNYVQAYANAGITVNYVTPQNEPGNATTTYPGMLLSPSQEKSFVDNDLSPALAGAGLSTQILGYDWNWSGGWSTSDIGSVLSGAPSNVAGTAWHCYGGDPSTQSTVEGTYSYPRWQNFISECSNVGVDNGYGISGSTTVDNFAYYLGWNSQNLIVGGLNNWASGVQLFNIAENQYYGLYATKRG